MRRDLTSYACIFFDFDGVIVDSVEAKIAAFGELYQPFGADVRRAVEAYQRAVPGETRFNKIPRFHRDLLGLNLSPEEVETWCKRLSQIVLAQVVACPLLPDVAPVLSLLQRRRIPAHIVSGTPHDELQTIVQRKGLTAFFESSRGSPQGKADIVQDILARAQLRAQDCLFIGDAMADYECAVETGADFLGIMTRGAHPFPDDTNVVMRLRDALVSGSLFEPPIGANDERSDAKSALSY